MNSKTIVLFEMLYNGSWSPGGCQDSSCNTSEPYGSEGWKKKQIVLSYRTMAEDYIFFCICGPWVYYVRPQHTAGCILVMFSIIVRLQGDQKLATKVVLSGAGWSVLFTKIHIGFSAVFQQTCWGLLLAVTVVSMQPRGEQQIPGQQGCRVLAVSPPTYGLIGKSS